MFVDVNLIGTHSQLRDLSLECKLIGKFPCVTFVRAAKRDTPINSFASQNTLHTTTMMHRRTNHIVIAATLSTIALWSTADAASSPLSYPTKNWYKNRDACNDFFTKEIIRLCTAPAEQWPCFAGSKLVDGKQSATCSFSSILALFARNLDLLGYQKIQRLLIVPIV
jgi:hypothetical protein